MGISTDENIQGAQDIVNGENGSQSESKEKQEEIKGDGKYRKYSITGKDFMKIMKDNYEDCHLYQEASRYRVLKKFEIHMVNGNSTVVINEDSSQENIKELIKVIMESEPDKFFEKLKERAKKNKDEKNGTIPVLGIDVENADPELYAIISQTSDKKSNGIYINKNNDYLVRLIYEIYQAYMDCFSESGNDNEQTPKWTIAQIEYELANTIDETITNTFHSGNKQIIFTGAPGTGKTYSVKKYIKDQLGLEKRSEATENDNGAYKIINFHSSYDYTDFVEGIRPVSLPFAKDGEDNPEKKDGKINFVKLDGTFKAFCRAAAEAENQLGNQTENQTENQSKKQSKKFYFMIDEINRADLAKVFGELMLCLEEGYRGKEHKVVTQYQNLPTVEIDKEKGVLKYCEEDVFKDGFYVPENVYIIGTMNNIDRSIDTFDFALRRRFQWQEVEANDQMLETAVSMFGKMKKWDPKETDKNLFTLNEITQIVNRLRKLNNLMLDDKYKKFGLGKEYFLGASYLKRIEKNNRKINYSIAWENNIKPILTEYVRGFDGADIFVKECEDIFVKGSVNKK